MAGKKKLYLVDVRKYDSPHYHDCDFVVEKVVNALSPKTGQKITESQVDNAADNFEEIIIRAPLNKDFSSGLL